MSIGLVLLVHLGLLAGLAGWSAQRPATRRPVEVQLRLLAPLAAPQAQPVPPAAVNLKPSAASPAAPLPTPLPIPEPSPRAEAQPAAVAAPAPRADSNAPALALTPAPSPEARSDEMPRPALPAATPRPVSAGSLRYRVEPAVEVPRLSRRAGEQGRVQLRVVFDIEGRPRQVRLLVSSGFARLDAQALEAMQAARIEPVREAGRPIEVEATATLEYQLD